MADTDSLASVEIVPVKVELEITEEKKEDSEPSAKNGGTPSEGRSKRPRKSAAYHVEDLYSDSDPQSEADGDPEFRPVAPHGPTPNIPNLQITGYALFCNDNRSAVQKQFPDMPANKISMKLSHMWSSLPAGTKRSYSCRARHMARAEGNPKRMKRDSKKEQLAAEDELEPVVVFCCLWGRCNFQYELVDECAQHITDEHLQPLCLPDTEVLKAPSGCFWQGCQRHKRCSLPFVQFERLLRHMSEEHVLVGKPVRASERSENFIPRRAMENMDM